jgi:hypothetical protein
MPKDSYKMQDSEFRETVFKTVFGNPEGEMVLDYLDDLYRIRCPDMMNPNDVYYRLGRQSVIAHIRNIITTKGENNG